MSDSKNPENTKEEDGNVSTNIWQPVRDMSQHSALNYQVRQQDNTQHVNQGRRSDTSDSTSVWQQLRGEETHMNRPKIDFCSMQISNYEYLGQVFQNLQKILGTTGDLPKFGIEAFKTNVLMWGLFKSSTMKAAVHLGPNYTKHVEMYKNAQIEEIQNLFDIIQKLIWDHHGEIQNVKPLGSTDPSWTRSTLSHGQVGESKSTCFFQMVFCAWENFKILQKQIEDGKAKWPEFRLSTSYGELLGSDGEPIELEWNILPGFTSWQILQKIQNDLQERNVEPEQFGDRIIFMSVCNDIDWTMKGNE